MKKISIVIPVYNEDFFIRGLLESISQINYPKEDFDVNVVCDGCTDGTVSIVKNFPFARLIELKDNVGRYAARKIGAEIAAHPNILFLDARCTADPNILSAINKSDEKVIIGKIQSEKKPGFFDTFYMSIRRIVFYKYFSNTKEIIELNKDNFDSLPKGTTVLYVQKEVLFQAFKELSHIEMGKNSSDDTKLLRTIVDHTSIALDPGVKIIYFYRKSFWANLIHLYDFIASSFIDYYLSPSQKYFWLIILFPLLGLLAIFLGVIFIPVAGFTKLALITGFDLIIALFLARSFREFYIILAMLPLCVATFYLGVIRGIVLKIYNQKQIQDTQK
jgi:glycosyltransferase involved in cell wall biosynthesis